MATDKRPIHPTGSGSAQGGDVGGIPGTMKRGVAEATDRKAARRDGVPDNDTASGAGSAMSRSTGSGAYAPEEGIDRTGAPAAHRDADRRRRDADDPLGRGERSADGDESGQDDSVTESLGKAISEPFRSS